MAGTKQLNIYEKLARVRKAVEVIQKNENGYGYKYVSEDEILAKVSVMMEKYKISLIPGIVPSTVRVDPYTYKKTKSTSKGEIYEENVNEILVTSEMTWTWINNENPDERVVVNWALVGQQSDASQAFGSGLTYSSRYFLLKYFSVATPEDDPDKFRGKQAKTLKAEDRLVAEKIVEEIDSEVREFLAAHKDKATDVKEFFEGFVDDGDYLEISDPTLAAKALSDFKEKFLKS